MIQTQNRYPVFIPNQILTNAQLNQLHQYLDQQNRLSRTHLTGMGIVGGLQFRLEEEASCTLVLSCGYGLSSEGYLLELPQPHDPAAYNLPGLMPPLVSEANLSLEEIRFARVRQYTDPLLEDSDDGPRPQYDRWQHAPGDPTPLSPVAENQVALLELLTEDQEFVDQEGNEARPLLKEDLTDQVLVLYLENYPKDLKSCLTTDCTQNGLDHLLTLRALLVHRDCLQAIDPCAPLENRIDLPRLHHAVLKTTEATFAELSHPDQLNGAYGDMARFLREQLLERIPQSFEACLGVLNLADLQASMAELGSALPTLGTPSAVNQYHFDFYKDLATAYNEFTQLACTLIKACHLPNDFPRHLMIGSVDEEHLDPNHPYRHDFMAAPARNVLREDLKQAERMFRRMWQLIQSVNFGLLEAETIKLTPSMTEQHPLGKRALPYYYDFSEASPWWQASACCELPLLSYHQNELDVPSDRYLSLPVHPLSVHLLDKDFLRVEGHLGQSRQAVMAALQRLRATHHLDVGLCVLQLGENRALDDQLTQVRGETDDGLDLQARNWQEIFQAVSDGNTQGLQELFQEILDAQERLASLQASWQDLQAFRVIPCDLSALQLEYQKLRADLLCRIQQLQPLLGSLPDIVQEGDGEACLEFNQLSPNQQFGGDFNQPGDVIFTENDVAVSVEEFLFGQGGSAFNSVRVQSSGGQISLFVSNINLRFDFSQLGFTVNEVVFECGDFGGSENIAVNDGPIVRGEIQNNFGGQSIGQGITFNFEGQSNSLARATLRGGNIGSALIGGQEFFLLRVCVRGVNEQTGELQTQEIDIQAQRLRQLADLMRTALPKDLRHVNPQLLGRTYEDLIQTIIQIKLLHALLLPPAGGRILAYSNFPQWDEFLYALHQLHLGCIWPQMVGVLRQLVFLWEADFQYWAQQYPGMEHKAGVSPGETLLLVCAETGATEGPDLTVVGDFSVHKGCCGCDIDPAQLCFPPIAQADYEIIELSEEDAVAERTFGLLRNDLELDQGSTLIAKLRSSTSDLGASLSLDETNGDVTYQAQGLIDVIDHFTYFLQNECGEEAEGHVWVLLKSRQAASPPPVERAIVDNNFIGRVLAPSGSPIGQASIAIPEINVQEFSRGNGRFELGLEDGPYELQVSAQGFQGREVPIEVRPGGPKELSDILLEQASGDSLRFAAPSLSDTVTLSVAENFNISPEDALTRINETLSSRYEQRAKSWRSLQANNALQAGSALPQSEAFLSQSLLAPNPTPKQQANAYQETMDAIVTETKASPRTSQKLYRELAELVTHSYLDALLMQMPDKVHAQAQKTLARAARQLAEVGINPNGINTRWKGGELKKSLKLPSVDDWQTSFQLNQ